MAQTEKTPEAAGALSKILQALTRPWAELLILQLAILGGAVFVLIDRNGAAASRPALEGHWQTILIACAAMSISFGAALLLKARASDRDAERLEADYKEMISSTDALLKSSAARLREREANSLRKG
jgi:hypothetical protein